MGKEAKERTAKAFRAMKSIGILEDKVKPVLKKLLILYNKNWEFIEAEDYRALADAIFEQEEEAHVTEEPKQPLRRLRHRYRDGQTSPNPSNEIPLTRSHSMRMRNKGSSAISPRKLSGEKRPAPESLTCSVRLKEPKVEADIHLSSEKSVVAHALIVPTDEPITDGMPCSVVPDAIIHSDTSNRAKSSGRHGTGKGNRDPEPLESQRVSENGMADCTTTIDESRNKDELAMTPIERSSNLEIASSPSGEVKFYMSYDMSSNRPDFHMPTLESVLKSVEDNCLRSPKTSDLYIPMMDLMKEMCRSFLELGTVSNNQSPKSMDVAQTIDPVSKSTAVDARGGAGNSCSTPSKGLLVYYRTRFRASRPPKPLLLLPGDNLNHEQQLDKMGSGDIIVTNGEIQKKCSEETNDLSLGVVQKPQMAHEIIRSRNAVIDISKGQEKVAITLVNEVNDEQPPSFFYIPQNASFENEYVNISLAQIGDKNCCGDSCSGDCVSLSVPCMCAHETGGDFSYTPNGLVKEELLEECISMNRNPEKHSQFFCKECPLERSKCDDIIEPCKGHLVKKFIKECWWKCECNKQCGNRVVQRGISRSLQVFMAPGGKGWGLRTLEDLPKGAFVCEYVGEVLTNAELFERVLQSPKGEKYSYPVVLDADWCAGVLKDEESLCLDATYYGNVARFINHRCHDSNLVEIPVEVETSDHRYYHVAFFTTRKVKALEELTWDYGIDFEDLEHPIKAFRCQCGSKYCRNIKRSSKRSRR